MKKYEDQKKTYLKPLKISTVSTTDLKTFTLTKKQETTPVTTTTRDTKVQETSVETPIERNRNLFDTEIKKQDLIRNDPVE